MKNNIIVFTYKRIFISVFVFLIIGCVPLPLQAREVLLPPPSYVITQTVRDLTPSAGKVPTVVSFSRLVSVAIALERSRAWESADADRLRELITREPHNMWFSSLQHLLEKGDVNTAITLRNSVRDGSLPPADMVNAIHQLEQAGFILAANALTAVNSGDPREVITELLRIPREKRQPIEAYLYDRNNPSRNPLNYMKLAQTALSMYRKTAPEDQATRDGLLHFLALFGFGSSQFNLNTIARVYTDGNAPGALYMLQWVLTRYPDDTTLQASAFQSVMFGTMGCNQQDQTAMIRWMCQHLQPHYARRFRRDFYIQLARNPKIDGSISLKDLKQEKDILIAAESHLALQEFETAGLLFTKVLHTTQVPLSRRLAAWSGLWDAAPDAAVAAAPSLTEEILTLPAGPERTALIRWYGNEMGRVAPFIANGWSTNRPKATPPACYTEMASSMTQLLTSDPVACLRLENANGPSLRYAAALVYLMAKMGEEANDVVAREIEYKEYPRPGTLYAPTAAKLTEEQTFSSPRLNETEEVVKKLVQTMEGYDKSFGKANTTAISPEPPNSKVILDKCTRIAESTDASLVKDEVRRLGMHMSLAITYLDPKPEGVRLNDAPPTPRAINMEYVRPLFTAIDHAFQNPLACQHSPSFIVEGLQPSMLTASNPELLDELFALSTSILDKCVAATGKGNTVQSCISNYANLLDGRQVWNLKPYAEKLKARYLTKP